MFYLLKTDAEQEKLNAALKEIEKDPERLEGTLELVYEMMSDKECGSYRNNRIMWLGWQLEEKGISVTWEQTN